MKFKFWCILFLCLSGTLMLSAQDTTLGYPGKTTATSTELLDELVKNETAGLIPEEKAMSYLQQDFMEIKAFDAEMDIVSKENIEKLAANYIKDAEIFQRYYYSATALPGGIDHIAAGVATRNTGYGTIRLRGLCPNTVVVSAILYFGTIYGARQAPPGVVSVVFNGRIVNAALIGTTREPCWGTGGQFAAYRVFVTTMVAGNGDYTIDRLPSALRDGRDPWKCYNNTAPLSEGASLVVLYSNASVPLNSSVEIHHVVRMFSSNLTVLHQLPLPITDNRRLKHTRLGADGQTGTGLRHMRFATDERTYFSNNAPVKGTGATLNKDSDWNGYDGEPLNQLWDTHTMEIPNAIPNGATQYTIRYTSQGDCIVPVAHILTALY